MRVIGLAGWSGAGKTTLVVRLVPELVRRGLTVSTMKHAHHGFDVDQPGKDSYRHREAGATEVLVASERRWALLHANSNAAEATAAELMRRMTPVDLLIVEASSARGMTSSRSIAARPAILLYPEDRHIVAVLSDEPCPAPLPVIGIDDVGAIADFIIAHCGLAAVRAAAGH
jgi:molybdopterin-guanine dinucleotide biosynthesis protein B